ncbi:MAG: APC family permease [Pyrinomonadaceae bacterium]
MTDEKLVRGIGRWDFTAIVINTIIGAGIFGLPSKAFALIGSHSIYAIILCAVIVGLVVLCYAEVSSRFNETGGPALYAQRAFGDVAGFEVGWLYWIVRVATFAANCNLFVTYLGFFFPAAAQPTVRIAIIFLVVGALAAINLAGVRQSALVTNVFTIGKVLPLVVFAAVGMFFVDTQNFNFAATPDYTSFSAAVLLLIYAFVGFEAAVVLAGETKEPEKNVPFALLTALAVVTVLYIAVQVVSIGTLPGLAASERPLADAAAGFMGPIGAAVITIGALVSIIGNLNVGLLSSTRLLFSLADQRHLPNVLAKTHERTKTPWVSIVLTSLVILVLTIQSSFLTAVAIATITRLLVYATTCLALPIFRRRDDVAPALFRVAGGVVAAILSVGLIAWLLTNVDWKKEGWPILAAAVLGLLIYLANRVLGRRDPI